MQPVSIFTAGLFLCVQTDIFISLDEIVRTGIAGSYDRIV